jgi:hypothetical protein
MTNDKATPRPWSFAPSSIEDGKFVIGTSDWKKTIALLDSQNDPEANAELIVRCVNGYDKLKASNDALLEACKKSLEQFTLIAEHYGYEVADAEIDMLKKIIAQTEKGN